MKQGCLMENMFPGAVLHWQGSSWRYPGCRCWRTCSNDVLVQENSPCWPCWHFQHVWNKPCRSGAWWLSGFLPPWVPCEAGFQSQCSTQEWFRDSHFSQCLASLHMLHMTVPTPKGAKGANASYFRFYEWLLQDVAAECFWNLVYWILLISW